MSKMLYKINVEFIDDKIKLETLMSDGFILIASQGEDKPPKAVVYNMDELEIASIMSDNAHLMRASVLAKAFKEINDLKYERKSKDILDMVCRTIEDFDD